MKRPTKLTYETSLTRVTIFSYLNYQQGTSMVIKIIVILIGFTFHTIAASPLIKVHHSEQHSFVTEVVNDELNFPWGIAFLPSGEILITEKKSKKNYVLLRMEDYFKNQSKVYLKILIVPNFRLLNL